jgi:hypothetical protein
MMATIEIPSFFHGDEPIEVDADLAPLTRVVLMRNLDGTGYRMEQGRAPVSYAMTDPVEAVPIRLLELVCRFRDDPDEDGALLGADELSERLLSGGLRVRATPSPVRTSDGGLRWWWNVTVSINAALLDTLVAALSTAGPLFHVVADSPPPQEVATATSGFHEDAAAAEAEHSELVSLGWQRIRTWRLDDVTQNPLMVAETFRQTR